MSMLCGYSWVLGQPLVCPQAAGRARRRAPEARAGAAEGGGPGAGLKWVKPKCSLRDLELPPRALVAQREASGICG